MPNVQVRLHDRRVEDNVDALLAGKLELAFIFVAPKPGALRGLRFLELSREHICLAVSPSHPFPPGAGLRHSRGRVNRGID